MHRESKGLVLVLLICAAFVARAQDFLPSWNDGPSKRAITAFVTRVTTEGSRDFVPPEKRIAVFDNDGTLWCEQPMYFQAIFALDRIKALAAEHPERKNTEPYHSVLTGDLKSLIAGGRRNLLEIMQATHAGITTDEFAAAVRAWFQTSRHPKYGRPYNEMVYQPMLELLAYLRGHGFKTYIVSGGGIDFIRAFAEQTYGIPPEQVVGSSGALKFEIRGGMPVLVKEPKVEFVDDGPNKPVGIERYIGRRPIMAFGNSDGDLEMLQWTSTGDGPRFGALVHHTDAQREYAYDRASPIGKLDKALDEARARGWIVVDMQTEWRTIFPEPSVTPAFHSKE